MRASHWLTLAAVACLGLWVVLAFVFAVPSGWVHLPLAVGVLVIVRAIVAADAERAGDRAP